MGVLKENKESYDELLEDYGRVLGNEVRRKILKLLGSQGIVGFVELREALGLEVGSIYHHLKKMGAFITQDEEKRYLLTLLGIKAYEMLQKDEEFLSDAYEIIDTEERVFSELSKFLLGGFIFSYIKENPKRYILEAFLAITIIGWVSFHADLIPILIFFVDNSGFESIAIMIEAIASWIAIWMLFELVYHFTTGKPGWNLDLGFLISIPFALLPLTLFPTVVIITEQFDIEFILTSITATILLVTLQVWTIGMLYKALEINKEIKSETATRITLKVTYVCIAIILIFIL